MKLAHQKNWKDLEKKIRIIDFQVLILYLVLGPTVAIVHYRANQKTNRIIKKNDVYSL